MKAEFYDVQAKEKVIAKVTEKVAYGNNEKKRYAFRGVTDEGRILSRFVTKKEFLAAKV